MLKEFKAFAMRGNVIDLAVAVIIGAAFGKIVGSLVNDLLMPLVGLALGGINFSGLSFTLGEAVIQYGAFIQSVIDFVIIAFVIFLLLKAVKTDKAPAPITTKECPHCCTDIPLKASRCPHCIAQL